MGLETANYITDLDDLNPISTDPGGQGDDHIRLIKKVLLQTFPNLDGPVPFTTYDFNNPVPIGIISMWYGTSASIPTGWALCDGSTVARSDGDGDIITPDLRGFFVRAANGVTTPTGSTGGDDEPTSSSNGAHTHDVTVASGGTHTHSGTANSGGAHTHTLSISNDGGHHHGGATQSAGSHNHGGSTGSHTLTTAQLPSHRHFAVADQGKSSYTAPNTSESIVQTLSDGATDSNHEYELCRATAEATVGRTSATGSGDSHDHSIGTSGTNHTHDITWEANHSHSGSTANSGGAHTHALTVDSGGAHTHAGSTASNGSHTHTVDVIPPYYALHYIMKV